MSPEGPLRDGDPEPVLSTSPPAHAPQPARAAEGRADPPPVWHSEQLLGKHVEVLILHNNEVYRLRRTRQGKLILYK